MVLYINFQPLGNKRKGTVRLKTTSLTGPSWTKLLAAIQVNQNWSFHTSVSQWLSQGRLC